jgi:hypothetical protein
MMPRKHLISQRILNSRLIWRERPFCRHVSFLYRAENGLEDVCKLPPKRKGLEFRISRLDVPFIFTIILGKTSGQFSTAEPESRDDLLKSFKPGKRHATLMMWELGGGFWFLKLFDF